MQEEFENDIPRARLIMKELASSFGSESSYPWQVWGLLEMRLKNAYRGRLLFEKALSVNSLDHSTWIVWGECEEMNKNWDHACSVYRRGANINKSVDTKASIDCWIALANVNKRYECCARFLLYLTRFHLNCTADLAYNKYLGNVSNGSVHIVDVVALNLTVSLYRFHQCSFGIHGSITSTR
jgi:hypothetical protein